MDTAKIDEAARLGFQSAKTGAHMPHWVANEEIFVCAWLIGQRQGAAK